MKASYDKYYMEKDYFMSPYSKLIEFFSTYTPKGSVLDLGCGQGRDSIPLARMGYKVHGVDISIVGLNQMMEVANQENLAISSEVFDIYNYKIKQHTDVILLDSMFHFYKNDLEKELGLLDNVLNSIKVNGLVCIFINKSAKPEKVLKTHISTYRQFEVLKDEYIEYESYNSTYLMYIIKKVSQID